jgi:hypothetical protein
MYHSARKCHLLHYLSCPLFLTLTKGTSRILLHCTSNNGKAHYDKHLQRFIQAMFLSYVTSHFVVLEFYL